jgi:hypothetical protein
MTQFRDIFAALAEPFRAPELKSKPGKGGGTFFYITSRTAMNRLDDVLGPENWWDGYEVGRKSVVCVLTIRLPDGSLLTKRDAGGSAGLSDEGDDEKSAYSDAFKRAAVKFGVARHIYRDGVADLQSSSPSPASSSLSVGSDPPPVVLPRPLVVVSQPSSGKALLSWAQATSNNLGIDVMQLIREWGESRGLALKIQVWDIGDVTDCLAAMAKELDRRGLLALSPEARAQMVQERSAPPQATPGPLTIDPRDPLQAKKVEIKEIAKRLYQAETKAQATELAVMAYIKERCKAHSLVVPDSIRNLGVSSHITMILSALREDEQDMGIF